ncbi:MAG: methyl-accepting chemotaxis protein, partial [Acidobacteriota bacterium]
ELLEYESERLAAGVLVPAEESLARLDDLGTHRSDVYELELTVPTAVRWYTAANTELIDGSGSVIATIDEAQLRSDLAAHVALLRAKERAGLERAQLASAFAADSFAPQQHATVVSLIAEQRAYLATFQGLAPPRIEAAFAATEDHSAVAEVERLRAVALASPDGGFGVAAPDWFAIKTERIDLLKEVEDLSAANLATETRALEARAVRDYRIAIPVAVAVAALISLLAVQIPRSMRSKLRNLIAATEQVNAGTLDGEPIAIHSADEFGQLATSFNTMTESLATSHRALYESAALVSTQADATRSDSVALDTSIDQTATALDQMKHAIDEIASSAATAADTAREAVTTADTANHAIDDLHHSTDEIVTVLEAINSIAKKTSLLALNASIEAGRAGPAGRGFGVVADEVGQLAKSTEGAADEIAQRITAIRSNTSGVVAANEHVTTAIDEINNITANIAAAIEEQTSTTTEISRLMDQATSNTQSITMSINTLAELAGPVDAGDHEDSQLTAI